MDRAGPLEPLLPLGEGDGFLREHDTDHPGGPHGHHPDLALSEGQCWCWSPVKGDEVYVGLAGNVLDHSGPGVPLHGGGDQFGPDTVPAGGVVPPPHLGQGQSEHGVTRAEGEGVVSDGDPAGGAGLRLVPHHDVGVVDQRVEDDVVQVEVEPSELVDQQQPESVRLVDWRVGTASEGGGGEEGVWREEKGLTCEREYPYLAVSPWQCSPGR